MPVALSIALLALVVLVYAEVQERAALRAVAKSTASAGFLAVGLLAGLLSSGPVGVAILVGLVFGAIGDLLLLSDDKRWFLAGLVSFLLNHVAYCVAFVLLGVHGLTTAIAAAGLLVFAAGVWGWLGPHTGSLRVPVLAYIFVITTMVALSAGTVAARGPLLAGAAVLFFASDLAVARHRVVERSSTNKVVGLPLYYAAQLLFALSPVLA